MKSKLLVRPAIAALLSLVLASFVTAATLGGRTPPLAAEGHDPTDRNITRVTAGLLEHSQFSHHRLDGELAAKFLDRYLDSLDPAHLLFLQSDAQGFDIFRSRLPERTRREGDITPARTIFQRYLERLDQRVAYVTNLLHSEKFDFAGRDTCSFDREKAPRPRDLDAAHQIWRQNVRAEYLQEKLAGKKPADIVTALTRRYTRLLQTMRKLTREEVLEVYLNALAHVYDPHSDYLGRAEMDDFSIAMNLSLFGIGATLRAEDGYCRIYELVPGGPAARSGLLKPGDRIVAVGQADSKPADIVDMALPDAVRLIRGPKGTSVRLTLIPAGATDGSARRTITLVRDEVKLEDQQAKAHIVDLPQTNGATLRLGIIDLPSFYGGYEGPAHTTPSSATADVAKLIRKLEAEHIQGLILDLRHNGGGSLEEAITLTGLFIREGPVVQTRELDGRTDVGADTDPSELYAGPLIVLTSRFSASASEILAGALEDYGRALIVGDQSTFGKGTVQSVVPLAKLMDQNHLAHSVDPGALKVTIRKFYRPSGASTQLKGVAADIALPSLSDAADVGEAELKDPLPWDRVLPSDFAREDRVSPFLHELRDRSATRVAGDKDFGYLHEDIAQLKKSLATKTVVLNEADRRQEQEEAKAREELRKRERAARKESQPRTYEITLKNAGTAGLPAAATTISSPVASLSKSPAEATGDAEASTPQSDPVLRESERILADYVGMLHRPSAVAVAAH
ncbi:MAG: carboxy terminal-processing peptidase [Limisphaerales bacterium]